MIPVHVDGNERRPFILDLRLGTHVASLNWFVYRQCLNNFVHPAGVLGQNLFPRHFPPLLANAKATISGLIIRYFKALRRCRNGPRPVRLRTFQDYHFLILQC